FLFDEPLSNLDAKLRVQMRVEIRQLQRRLRTTSLYVTHDQLEALTLADRLVVLNGGRIEQVGSPMEVYARPATLFVAGFIGSPAMNMLPAAWLRERADGRLPAHLPAAADLVGIRPEDIRLGPPGPDDLAIEGRLLLLEPAGAESHLHLGLDGLDRPLTARLPHVPSVEEGSLLPLSVRTEALHPFDSDTGRRVD
ncbi:TOBE domain-containing protein, partial [Rubellimicrobium sp. CFH 75288]|uniref:TOBE domain-containing protein n=1 Tax=Rubellimicrobium sp. CFH 75288 TaxID=2697034 RepID=UPI001411F986